MYRQTYWKSHRSKGKARAAAMAGFSSWHVRSCLSVFARSWFWICTEFRPVLLVLSEYIHSFNKFWWKFELFRYFYFIVSFFIIAYFRDTCSIHLISEHLFLGVAWIPKIGKILCTLISLEQICSAYCFIKNGSVTQFSGQLLQ